jgi:hypothetical protein
MSTQTVVINGLTIKIPSGANISENVPQKKNYKISKLAFRNRFTFSEKVAIEDATLTDSEVRVLVKDQDSAEHIDLERLDTIQGVALLVNKGLVSVARSSEILSLDIADHEVFRG